MIIRFNTRLISIEQNYPRKKREKLYIISFFLQTTSPYAHIPFHLQNVKVDSITMEANELMIIVGLIMFILGSIGNLLSIYVFFMWSLSHSGPAGHRSNQTNNSPLYLFVSSIANLIIIIYALLTRILFDGFNHTITTSNIFLLCKFRYFTLHTLDLISIVCFCLATFDRYLITSRSVQMRQRSTTKKKTMLIILGIIILFSLHSIPIGIYFNLTTTGQCVLNDPIYSYYYLFAFQVVLRGIIPIIVLSILGPLTFRNLRILQHQTHGHSNHDKQISRMLLFMSFAIVVSSIPYCIEQIYDVMFAQTSSGQSSTPFLFHVIAMILFYTNPVLSFYIYFFSTPNFRHQIQKMFHRNQHVFPVAHEQTHLPASMHKIH